MEDHLETQYLLRRHLGIEYTLHPPFPEAPHCVRLHDYISRAACQAASAYYASGLEILSCFRATFNQLFKDLKDWLYYAHVCRMILPDDPRSSLILHLIKHVTEVVGVKAIFIGETKLGDLTVTYHYTGLCYEKLGIPRENYAMI